MSDDTAEIDSPADGETPIPGESRSDRARAAMRKPRVLAGSVAAAMILVGLGGFAIGHASTGDSDGDAQPSSQSDAGPGEGRDDGRGGPLGGQPGGPGSDPRLDEPDSVTEDSSAT